MKFLKKFSWPIVAIVFASIIYLTNSMTGNFVRTQTPQKYDELVVNFVTSINAADFSSASQLFTVETTKELLEAKKVDFEKIFGSSHIEKIRPLYLKTGKLQNRDVIQVEYMISLNSQKKLAARFLFADENGVTKILNTNFFEGDKIIESNSIFNVT